MTDREKKLAEYDRLNEELDEMTYLRPPKIMDSPEYQAKSKRIDELADELGIVCDPGEAD